MKRVTRKLATLRFSPSAGEMVEKLAQDTAWSQNVVANRLIELGMYFLTGAHDRADEAANNIEIAMQAKTIYESAQARVAALKNAKPRKRPRRPAQSHLTPPPASA